MTDTQRFHRRTGRLVELLNSRTSAERLHAAEEFNDGMVFSDKCLNKNELFSVRMDKKIASWSGSIEIGLIATNPSDIEIPKGAIAMKQGSWLLSGISVNVDGNVTTNDYCKDLDSLDIGDTVGIMRNDQNEIHLFINGLDQGVAAFCELETLWAMVNLYGKCAGISIVSDSNSTPPLPRNIVDDMSFSEMLFNAVPCNNPTNSEARHYARLMEHQSCSLDSEALTFYSKCGSLIQLLDLGTTAVRERHQDEFNNGVVMTNRTLKNDELFEIRINTLTEKWSGSIEMGVTTHAPDLLEIPSTMTNLRSGTVMLSGCGIITNGKGTRKEYLDFHLDELKVGDYIGLMRKERGTLHFFINGVDQGVAANNIPPHVYGVVDLYGRAVSVSIVPHHSVFERNRRNKAVVDKLLLDPHLFEEHGPLIFSSLCGKHIQLSSCKKIARRQNPLEDFNHAVVLSARTLESGEAFTVRVDDVVDKWSGSLEIGVTTYSPDSLSFPATMTNIRSGTWIMTATGVMINGVTVVDDYGTNVDSLAIGDTLGVCRKSNGNLHFYINGIDQGLAASNVPENIYAMIDLYGQVTKATIVDGNSKEMCFPLLPTMDVSANSTIDDPEGMSFIPTHTKLCIVADNFTTAYRKNPAYFYDGCIVLLNNKLKVGEPCEFEVNKIVPHWTGSLELGVTTETNLSNFPSSLIELKKNICVWTGRSVFENGHLKSDGIAYDTENLKPGSRIGLMLTESRGVVGYLDGVDIGVMFPLVSKDVYPIINLYGKCAQVTLVGNNKRSNYEKEEEISQERLLELSAYTVLKNNHRFYDYVPDLGHVFINDCKVILERPMRGETNQIPILYSAKALRIGELFEILINDTRGQVGSLSVGVITLGGSSLRTVAPSSKLIEDLYKYQPCCLISGNGVTINGKLVQQFYCPQLYSIDYDDKVGIMLYEDETLQLFFNGKSIGKIAGGFSMNDLPYFVVHMGARVNGLEVVDNAANIKEMKGPPSLSDNSSSDEDDGLYNVVQNADKKSLLFPLSRTLCGKNVRVTEDGLTATRVGSYNQAIVITAEPLTVNTLFQVKLKSLDEKWKSSLSIGVTGITPSEVKLTVDALKMTKLTWLFHDNSVFKNGKKIREKYGSGLQTIQVSQVVGLLVDFNKNLHMYVDGVDQGVAVSELPDICYGIVDLYGSCDEIEITKEQRETRSPEIFIKGDATSLIGEGCVEEISRISMKNCPYQELCNKYLKTMAIPDQFFTDVISCFCHSCFKTDADTIHKYQGEPPQQFTQPVGWCKFALRTHPNVDIAAVSKHWNVAFHCVKVGCVRKLLDLGEIPVESSSIYDLRCDALLDENLSKKNVPVLISPMINCIQENKSQNMKIFVDSLSGKSYAVYPAFQLFIQPSTFKVKPNTTDTTENVEWIMKDSSATILSHLLFKLELLK